MFVVVGKILAMWNLKFVQIIGIQKYSFWLCTCGTCFLGKYDCKQKFYILKTQIMLKISSKIPVGPCKHRCYWLQSCFLWHRYIKNSSKPLKFWHLGQKLVDFIGFLAKIKSKFRWYKATISDVHNFVVFQGISLKSSSCNAY